jgi:hypothetical protein
MSTNGSTEPHFNNERFTRAVIRLQSGNTNALGDIIELSQRRALTLIRHYGTAGYCTEGELLSDVNFKLMRSIRKFNPSKGSGFTFLSQLITNTLRTRVTTVRKNWSRHVELNSEKLASYSTHRLLPCVS